MSGLALGRAGGKAPPASEVAVLLCSFNGGAFLEQQLDSIAAQSYPALQLYVSDDGSADNTLDILERFRERLGARRLTIRSGPRRGHTENFLSLICSPQIEADYFAYADQDDIWDSGKLARAVQILEPLGSDQPALYCARTRLVSQNGTVIGFSPLFCRPPSFANALIQNIAGGNTMVMNRAARELLRTAGMVDVVTHDWWTYMLVMGAGGITYYDATPCVSYRQHEQNIIGANDSWSQRIARCFEVLNNRTRYWNNMNLLALHQSRHLLSKDSLDTLDLFSRARDASLFSRLLGFVRSGVYAQSTWGNMGLFLAALLKKI